MAIYDAPRAAFASVDFLGRISQRISDIAADVAEWNDQRITRKALSQLTDRELDDIGLCRGDIENVARITR